MHEVCLFYNRPNSFLGTDKRLWEEEVFKFAPIHQLRAVSPYLPRGDDRLDPTIYEMVLYEFLKLDPKVRKSDQLALMFCSNSYNIKLKPFLFSYIRGS